jgi:hypothetical protein
MSNLPSLDLLIRLGSLNDLIRLDRLAPMIDLNTSIRLGCLNRPTGMTRMDFLLWTRQNSRGCPYPQLSG